MGRHRDRMEILPAAERVRILSGRLKNLESGKGDFSPENRQRAMQECAVSLERAAHELEAGTA